RREPRPARDRVRRRRSRCHRSSSSVDVWPGSSVPPKARNQCGHVFVNRHTKGVTRRRCPGHPGCTTIGSARKRQICGPNRREVGGSVPCCARLIVKTRGLRLPGPKTTLCSLLSPVATTVDDRTDAAADERVWMVDELGSGSCRRGDLNPPTLRKLAAQAKQA